MIRIYDADDLSRTSTECEHVETDVCKISQIATPWYQSGPTVYTNPLILNKSA